MASYAGDGSSLRVRQDLAEAHQKFWRRLGKPGTWLEGATRISIASEVRQSPSCTLCREIKSAVSPYAVTGRHQGNGGLKAEWVDDIWRPLWHKLAVNCCINALSAIRQCRNGELLGFEEAMATIRGLAAEVRQVIAAAGLGFDFPQLFDEVVEVIKSTADNYSSMYQDASRGRETEIDSINGYICARGTELGVATPLNRALVDAIRAL